MITDMIIIDLNYLDEKDYYDTLYIYICTLLSQSLYVKIFLLLFFYFDIKLYLIVIFSFLM